MMMMNPCVIHRSSQEEALAKEKLLKEALDNERHLEEALHKERHLNKTHQQIAGGKITDRHQDPQKKKNMAKQMQHTTVTNHTSRRKMKSWKLQQPSGRQGTSMMMLKSSTSHHQHHPPIPGFLYGAGIICSRQADGSVERNSSGERVINLREWAFLLSNQ